MSPSARREDVPIETTDARVRAARLRRLPAERFTPPHPAAPDAAFAAEVEAFAATYWTLRPADRRARWEELSDRPVGPAAARLADLARGLNVAPVSQTEIHTAEIAQLVRELFVMPPAARAARRLAWVTADDRRDERWMAASRALLRTDLPLARLDERLFDWFSLRDRPEPVAAVAESAAWVPVARRAPEAVAPAAAAAGGFGCLTGPGALIIAGIVILRLIFAAAGGPRSTAPSYAPPPYPPPSYPSYIPPPTYTPSDFQPAPKGDAPFTGREVMQFFTYEEAKKKGTLGPGEAPPPRYGRWVEQGRPTRVQTP